MLAFILYGVILKSNQSVLFMVCEGLGGVLKYFILTLQCSTFACWAYFSKTSGVSEVLIGIYVTYTESFVDCARRGLIFQLN